MYTTDMYRREREMAENRKVGLWIFLILFELCLSVAFGLWADSATPSFFIIAFSALIDAVIVYFEIL